MYVSGEILVALGLTGGFAPFQGHVCGFSCHLPHSSCQQGWQCSFWILTELSFIRVSHLVFTKLVARPAHKPSTKPATAPPHKPLGRMQWPATPIVAWFGLYPMKSKLTEQTSTKTATNHHWLQYLTLTATTAIDTTIDATAANLHFKAY